MTQQSKQENFDFDDRKESGPVECLGMTFNTDDERRTFFAEKLREKLKDRDFRKLEGFPIGEDEDILARNTLIAKNRFNIIILKALCIAKQQ